MDLNEIVSNKLLDIVDDIKNGDSDITEEHAELAMSLLMSSSDRNLKLSKYQACQYLKMSRSKFDNLISEGKIPKGKKQAGFKELF